MPQAAWEPRASRLVFTCQLSSSDATIWMFCFSDERNKINDEIDSLPDFELLSLWRQRATSEEHQKRPEFCSKESALPSMWHSRPGELKAGGASSWKGHIYLSAQRERGSRQLQLGSTHFGKYFWLLWFYAFRVPFLSTRLVQTHWRWAEASKGDAEFHTHLCWVCKKKFLRLTQTALLRNKNKNHQSQWGFQGPVVFVQNYGKAGVGHVTYKPKGFIMKPERNPQASVLKYTPMRRTKKEKENLSFGLVP